MTIRFTIPAVPVAQPRQRHRIIQTRDGRSFAHNYTPAKDPVNAFKASVQQALHDNYRGAPLDGPISLEVAFVMPRPKRLRWKRRAMPRAWHDTKPDGDNIEKALVDALTGLLWHDDKQLAYVRRWKFFAAGDEQPHVELEARQLTGMSTEMDEETINGDDAARQADEALGSVGD